VDFGLVERLRRRPVRASVREGPALKQRSARRAFGRASVPTSGSALDSCGVTASVVVSRRSGEPRLAADRKICNPCAEKTVEVVGNHEDGTRSAAWQRPTEGERLRLPGVDARGARRQRGEVSGTQERMVVEIGRGHTYGGSDPGASGRSEGEVKSRRLPFDRPRSMGGPPGETPVGQLASARKGQEGCGRAMEPLPEAGVDAEHFGVRRTRDLGGPANSRELTLSRRGEGTGSARKTL
jgi:hypothetical protein